MLLGASSSPYLVFSEATVKNMTKLQVEVQTTVRRVAAKILGDYTPPSLACSEELFQALEAAAGRTTVDV